jgi:hypothetical protein
MRFLNPYFVAASSHDLAARAAVEMQALVG